MNELKKQYTIDFAHCPDTRKKMFDYQEAAKRNPVRRIPVSEYTPMPSLKGCRAPILVEKADDTIYPSIARPFERVETRA